MEGSGCIELDVLVLLSLCCIVLYVLVELSLCCTVLCVLVVLSCSTVWMRVVWRMKGMVWVECSVHRSENSAILKRVNCTHGTGWHWEHYRVQTVLQCDVEHTGWYEEQNKVKCGTEQGGTSHGMEGNGCCGASLGQWRVTWKRPLKFFNESALAAHKCCISMTAFWIQTENEKKTMRMWHQRHSILIKWFCWPKIYFLFCKSVPTWCPITCIKSWSINQLKWFINLSQRTCVRLKSLL